MAGAGEESVDLLGLDQVLVPAPVHMSPDMQRYIDTVIMPHAELPPVPVSPERIEGAPPMPLMDQHIPEHRQFQK